MRITFNKGCSTHMKKSLCLAAAAAFAIASPAFAGNDNGPKGGDSSAVAGAAAGAVSGSSSSAVGGGAIVNGNSNGGDATATGGTGGRADASASSSLGSLNKFGGDGGSVLGSGNSSNLNSNTNLLGQGQQQGQLAISDQGQSQSQNTNQANSQTNAQTNSQSVGGQTATNTTNVDASDRSVTNYEAQKRNPVNTAYAAPLSIGGGVCAYTPFSAGASVIGFSGSASVATIDAGCQARAFADVMARLGDTLAARELLKQDAGVKAAYDAAGIGGGVALAEPVKPNAVVAGQEEPKSFSFTPMQPIPNPKTPRGE